MWMFIFIALGGALGAVSRYATGLGVTAVMGPGFQPVATLLVNIAGAGLMGCCYALIGLGMTLSEPLRGLIMVGFLGALTTFSSFSLDAVSLIEKGEIATGIGYIFGSVILSLAAFLLIMLMTRSLLAGH